MKKKTQCDAMIHLPEWQKLKAENTNYWQRFRAMEFSYTVVT